MEQCMFCRIVDGSIPGQFVLREPDVVAFRDVTPQAPQHLLVIPVEHHDGLADLEGREPLAGRLLATVARVAREAGLASDGYRVVINSGADGGQSVGHIHLHVLGGRAMGWPPFPA